jgi:long-chain acyl-CoA synthetase
MEQYPPGMNLASFAETNLSTFGDYERLVFEDKTYTNHALHEMSRRFAHALTDLGLSPGDKVVVMMPNGPEVLIAYPAIWRAGMTVIPVLFLLEAQELEFILTSSGAKAVITSSAVYPKVAEATRRLENKPLVILADQEREVPAGSLQFADLVARSNAPLEIVDRRGDDLATILYTSGTTGRPKGVMQTHDNLRANAMNSWKTAANREPRETNLLALPLAHSFGLSVLMSGYLFGTRSILMRWFDAGRALKLIEKYRVKAMSGVPTMFVDMLMHPNAGRHDTSSVKRWGVGAAPMPIERVLEFESKFGGTMYVGYGLSEAGPSVAGEREGMRRKQGSTGVPLEGVRVKIVDDDGVDLPCGKVGEICASGSNVSPGYYDNVEATAETFRDGWLHTGDLGYLDDEGYLFVVDRKKDLIIRGGLNIYPKDVEEVIHTHPGVQEVAVVGVPDSRMGEEVCAYIVAKPGANVSPDQIIAHCQANLAKYKTPRYVHVVDDLPRTGIGKVQKKELRKLATGAHAKDYPFAKRPSWKAGR